MTEHSSRSRESRGQPAGNRPAVVDVVIQTIAAGGDGVGPDGSGRITFIPGTAPTERVRARLEESKKNYARAELIEVIEPSPSRVEPVCPLFSARRCGGCQWQHLDLAEQHRAKTAIVERELRRHIAGGLQLLPMACDVAPYKWRRRARLHWFRPRGAERASIGFFGPRSHRVADVDACPQMTRALSDVLSVIRSELGPHLGSRGSIELLAGHNGEVHVSIDGWCSPKWASRLIGKGGLVGTIVGVVLHDRKADRDSAIQWGKRSISLEPGLRGRADRFAQASETGNQALLAAVDRACGDREGQRIIEFYAGTGNLTRVLARGKPAEVVATDSRRVSWRHDLRIGPAQDIACELVEDGYYFDLAVLDPPRIGAKELLSPLIELHPARIVYASCDPATLARDLDVLVESGYRAPWAQPLDLMPQTAHVEVVVRLDAVERVLPYGE
ncbi:MAG: TRAM domain-containing protein [Proteobacteria bacterium]|nr:TRAM domain-containing protein [Pseudomonadota bacterium]